MFSLDNYVDKTYILHLEHRNDRLEHLNFQLNKINLTNYEIFNAYHPKTSRTPLFYLNLMKEKSLFISTYLCVLFGHLDIIRIAKEKGYKKILILEDDVSFNDNFNIKFKKILDEQLINLEWDLFWLGLGIKGCTLKEVQDNMLTKNIGKIDFMGAGNFAYIIKDYMYDYILEKALYHMDSSLYCMDSFCFGYLRKTHKCLHLCPNTVNTRVGKSDSDDYFFSQHIFDLCFSY